MRRLGDYLAIFLYLMRCGSSASAPSVRFLYSSYSVKLPSKNSTLPLVLVVQDVGGDTVEEPTVVRDHHGAAREFQQGVFQRAQGFDIQVVGRFIEQQHVAANLQQLGQVQTATLTAGQLAHAFALIDALEVEAADIGAARHLGVADAHDVPARRRLLPTRFSSRPCCRGTDRRTPA